jgi:hypothetical protein
MASQVLERVPATRRRPHRASLMAAVGAAAFAAAAVWYTLAVRGVTVAAAPRFGPHISLLRSEHIYYRWLVTTLPQERFYIAIAIAGFLCLAGSRSSRGTGWAMTAPPHQPVRFSTSQGPRPGPRGACSCSAVTARWA